MTDISNTRFEELTEGSDAGCDSNLQEIFDVLAGLHALYDVVLRHPCGILRADSFTALAG